MIRAGESGGRWGTPGRAGLWAVAAGSRRRREIGGGGAGARAREGKELKCPSRQRAERDIGWASVRRAKTGDS
jgi:hypothetical protein